MDSENNSGDLFAEQRIKTYRKIVDVTAFGLILQMSLFVMQIAFPSALPDLVSVFGFEKGTVAADNLISSLDNLLYLAMFLIPAALIGRYLPGEKNSIGFSFKLSKFFVPLAFLTIGGIVFSERVSLVLEKMINFFGIGFKDYQQVIPTDSVGIVLYFISTVIIPPVAEEILFRKVVLGGLLPYGKTFAVMVSAAAFSLMHCNPSQTLYTFVGGLFLGMAAVKSGSVIPPMLIHALNNALAFSYYVLGEYAEDSALIAASGIIDTAFMIGGVVSLIVLAVKNELFFKRQPRGEFSPTRELLRVSAVFYVVYALIVSLRGIYII